MAFVRRNAFLCSFLVTTFLQLAAAQRPTVTLNDGVYVGTTSQVASATGTVDLFFGIPYAAKPERFGPPQPRAKGSEQHDAINQPPVCPQQQQPGITYLTLIYHHCTNEF
jgi:carboxylesterase type B